MKKEKSTHLPVVCWVRKLHSMGLDYIIKIIEEFPEKSKLNEREKYWIALHGGPIHNPGSRLLNCTWGGDGPTGIKCPEHVKEYFRQLYKGKKQSAEMIRKLTISKNKPESREAARLARLGKPSPMKGTKASVETRRLQSESAKARGPHGTRESRRKWSKRRLRVRDSDGNVFESRREAGEFHGVSSIAIRRAIETNRPVFKIGKSFEYLPGSE